MGGKCEEEKGRDKGRRGEETKVAGRGRAVVDTHPPDHFAIELTTLPPAAIVSFTPLNLYHSR